MNGREKELKWSCLWHFGSNMWSDRLADPAVKKGATGGCYDRLLLDEGVWREWTDAMPKNGCNQIVVDIGEGLVYPSHPELGVKGSWSADRMHEEVLRLKKLGLEPIPKLNFSATHDSWLGDYHRMVSTPEYYRVCKDVISDVVRIFEKPALFHLGYDEETDIHQEKCDTMIIRQGELWWHDFLWFEKTVSDLGVRPWIWADYIWWHKDAFVKRMPKRVLQSNWYYNSAKIDPAAHQAPKSEEAIRKHWDQRVWTAAYQWLEDAKFDQVPCGSNCGCKENFGAVVEWGRTHVPAERLKGFCMAPWILTTSERRDKGLEAIALVGEARKAFEAKGFPA